MNISLSLVHLFIKLYGLFCWIHTGVLKDKLKTLNSPLENFDQNSSSFFRFNFLAIILCSSGSQREQSGSVVGAHGQGGRGEGGILPTHGHHFFRRGGEDFF